MSNLREIAKKIPGVVLAYDTYSKLTLKGKSVEEIFTNIYHGNKWEGKGSFSGSGSDLDQTGVIVDALPAFLAEFDIRTIVDVPCGDFHWMRKVDLKGIQYTGADIVAELIRENQSRYASDGVRFCKLNLLSDPLPKADLILCRDCLVHFSFQDIASALRNMYDSGSTYLLTTTFTQRKENRDIATGQWRPCNFEAPPFCFPRPLGTINEGCREVKGAFHDKSLGLWKISHLRESLDGVS